MLIVETIKKVRMALAKGESQREVAKKYCMSRNTVRACLETKYCTNCANLYNVSIIIIRHEREKNMIHRHEINDADWERVKDLFPAENTGEGRPSKPNRLMLNGMLWQAKTGSPWRDLPERYGPWQTVYSRFSNWSKNDVFKKLFDALRQDADMQDLSIDSTSCKVHQHAAGAKKGLKMPKPTRI